MTNQQEDAELDIVNEILRRHDHENDGQTIDADLIKAHTNKAIGEVLDRLDDAVDITSDDATAYGEMLAAIEAELKLLAEVRERAIPSPTSPAGQ